jgi:hypothetical protein
MKCGHCHRDYARSERRCPHCDAPNPAAGFFQTSAVMISERGSNRVYHSVEEVPARLRTRLQQSTNSENSATILIADRRGHSEISKALRGAPHAAQRRLARAILGETAPGLPNWLYRFPGRRKAVLAVLFGLALALVTAVFSHHWR